MHFSRRETWAWGDADHVGDLGLGLPSKKRREMI